MGIRFVGKTVAEKLAIHFKNIDALMVADFETLIGVDEIGDRIAHSVIQYFSNDGNLAMVDRLKEAGLIFQIDENKYQVSSQEFKDMTFVISGVFEKYGRDELKSIIKDHGGKVVSSISGKLTYLVAGDKMGPAKLEMAEKLGDNIISETTFESLFNYPQNDKKSYFKN
jgi:DNA ligase (NAD+)